MANDLDGPPGESESPVIDGCLAGAVAFKPLAGRSINQPIAVRGMTWHVRSLAEGNRPIGQRDVSERTCPRCGALERHLPCTAFTKRRFPSGTYRLLLATASPPIPDCDEEHEREGGERHAGLHTALQRAVETRLFAPRSSILPRLHGPDTIARDRHVPDTSASARMVLDGRVTIAGSRTQAAEAGIGTYRVLIQRLTGRRSASGTDRASAPNRLRQRHANTHP